MLVYWRSDKQCIFWYSPFKIDVMVVLGLGSSFINTQTSDSHGTCSHSSFYYSMSYSCPYSWRFHHSNSRHIENKRTSQMPRWRFTSGTTTLLQLELQVELKILDKGTYLLIISRNHLSAPLGWHHENQWLRFSQKTEKKYFCTKLHHQDGTTWCCGVERSTEHLSCKVLWSESK